MEIDKSNKAFWKEINKRRKWREKIYEGIEETEWLGHFRKQLGEQDKEEEEDSGRRKRVRYETGKGDIMMKLKNQIQDNPCTDPDGALLIGNCWSALIDSLMVLFNESLITRYFPLLWKVAFITPVFKKGNKQDIQNNRPISKLGKLSKLFDCSMAS